jgi:hypothetical protein
MSMPFFHVGSKHLFKPHHQFFQQVNSKMVIQVIVHDMKAQPETACQNDCQKGPHKAKRISSIPSPAVHFAILGGYFDEVEAPPVSFQQVHQLPLQPLQVPRLRPLPISARPREIPH